MRAKPAVVNGAPRSEVNTNGDFGSCSLAAACARCAARRLGPGGCWACPSSPSVPGGYAVSISWYLDFSAPTTAPGANALVWQIARLIGPRTVLRRELDRSIAQN